MNGRCADRQRGEEESLRKEISFKNNVVHVIGYGSCRTCESWDWNNCFKGYATLW